ncbi:hypothetical protein ACKVMT_01665 [Halobacteriales archaeon Cl-PHB]
MDAGRLAVLGVVTVVLVVTVATGPLVGAVDVPKQGLGANADIGSGNATLSVAEAPSEGTLATGQYDDLRYLTIPDATVEIADVEGAPILTYTVDIEAIGYSRSSVYVITKRSEGTLALELQRDDVERSRLENDSYEARLQILLRTDGTERVVYEDMIPVGVEE